MKMALYLVNVLSSPTLDNKCRVNMVILPRGNNGFEFSTTCSTFVATLNQSLLMRMNKPTLNMQVTEAIGKFLARFHKRMDHVLRHSSSVQSVAVTLNIIKFLKLMLRFCMKSRQSVTEYFKIDTSISGCRFIYVKSSFIPKCISYPSRMSHMRKELLQEYSQVKVHFFTSKADQITTDKFCTACRRCRAEWLAKPEKFQIYCSRLVKHCHDKSNSSISHVLGLPITKYHLLGFKCSIKRFHEFAYR